MKMKMNNNNMQSYINNIEDHKNYFMKSFQEASFHQFIIMFDDYKYAEDINNKIIDYLNFFIKLKPDVNYFYCYELFENSNKKCIIKILIDFNINDNFKNTLVNYWNNSINQKNNLLISNIEDDCIFITNFENLENKKFLINSMLKNLKKENLLNIKYLINLYYIIFPVNIYSMSASLLKDCNLNLFIENIILHYYNIKNPFDKSYNIQKNKTLKELFNKFEKLHENSFDFMELKQCMDILQNKNISLEEKQKKINIFNDNNKNKFNSKLLILEKFKNEFLNFLKNIDLKKEFNYVNYICFFKLLNIDIFYKIFVECFISCYRLWFKDITELFRLHSNDTNISYRLNQNLVISIFKNEVKVNLFIKTLNNLRDLKDNNEKKKILNDFMALKKDLEILEDYEVNNICKSDILSFLKDIINFIKKKNIISKKDIDCVKYVTEVSVSDIYDKYHILLEKNWVYFWNKLVKIFLDLGFLESCYYENNQKYISVKQNIVLAFINYKNFTYYKLPDVCLEYAQAPSYLKEELISFLNTKISLKETYNKTDFLKIIKKDINKFLPLNKITWKKMKVNKHNLDYIMSLTYSDIQNFIGLNLWKFEHFLNKTSNNVDEEAYILKIYAFFEQLYLLKNYSVFDIIYFKTILDNKGYEFMIEAPLNFLTLNKYLKPLLDISFNENQKLTIIERISNFMTYYTIIDMFFKKGKKNKFLLYNILKNPFQCLIGNEIVADLYRLQGALILDLNLLEACKIVNLQSLKENEDFYSVLLNKLIFQFKNKSDLKLSIESFFKKKKIYIKEHDIIKVKKLSVILIMDLDTFFNFIDLKLIEKILIKYIYNIDIKVISDEVYTIIFNGEISLPSYLIKINKDIAAIFVNELINILTKTYSLLTNLGNLFKTISGLSIFLLEPIYVSIDIANKDIDYIEYLYVLHSLDIKKLSKYDDSGKIKYKRKSITTLVDLRKTNLLKNPLWNINSQNHSALLFNFLSYLSGNICIKCIEYFEVNKLNLFIDNNVFYVSIKDYYLIRNVYREKYIEVMVKDLLQIMLVNLLENLKINIFFKIYYDLILKNKSNIEKMFEKSTFIIYKFENMDNQKLLINIQAYVSHIHELYHFIKKNNIDNNINYAELKELIYSKYKSDSILKI